MGPIGVKAHLAPHPARASRNWRGGRRGQFGALRLRLDAADSWAYCLMMGGAGPDAGDPRGDPERQLHRQAARGAFDVLFKGLGGRVAHECILDTRPFAAAPASTVDDIAKRLIDCGFHAPTMSWPVAGTLDGRTHGVRNQSRVGPVLRCHAGHSRRDRGSRTRARSRRKTARCAMRRTRWRTWSATGTALTAANRMFPRGRLPGRQILAASQPGRQCLRRPQFGLHLPTSG